VQMRTLVAFLIRVFYRSRTAHLWSAQCRRDTSLLPYYSLFLSLSRSLPWASPINTTPAAPTTLVCSRQSESPVSRISGTPLHRELTSKPHNYYQSLPLTFRCTSKKFERQLNLVALRSVMSTGRRSHETSKWRISDGSLGILTII